MEQEITTLRARIAELEKSEAYLLKQVAEKNAYIIKVEKEYALPLQQDITTLREALARLEKVVDCMKVPKPKSENESFYMALDHYNELRRDIEL